MIKTHTHLHALTHTHTHNHIHIHTHPYTHLPKSGCIHAWFSTSLKDWPFLNEQVHSILSFSLNTHSHTQYTHKYTHPHTHTIHAQIHTHTHTPIRTNTYLHLSLEDVIGLTHTHWKKPKLSQMLFLPFPARAEVDAKVFESKEEGRHQLIPCTCLYAYCTEQVDKFWLQINLTISHTGPEFYFAILILKKIKLLFTHVGRFWKGLVNTCYYKHLKVRIPFPSHFFSNRSQTHFYSSLSWI